MPAEPLDPRAADRFDVVGTVASIATRRTRQGRPWAIVALTHDGATTEVMIFPAAWQALGKLVRPGATVAATVRYPATVIAMIVADRHWREPDETDEAEARAEIEAYLARTTFDPPEFAVVVDDHFRGTRVLGPYPRRAVASGVGFSRFGPIVFGTPTPWSVVRVEK